MRRRPGEGSTSGQRRLDRALAAGILVVEVVLAASLWGPQPVGWLWIGSQLYGLTDNVSVGLFSSFAGMMATLMGSLVVLKRLDHAWKLVRRAAGYEQRDGVLERIFIVSAAIVIPVFVIWVFFIDFNSNLVSGKPGAG